MLYEIRNEQDHSKLSQKFCRTSRSAYGFITSPLFMVLFKVNWKSYIWIFNLNLSSSSGFVDESDNNLKEIWIGLLPIRMEFPTSRRVVFECSK